ncbi:hypothetical protein ACFWY5_43975 [Nonomuraea sp. NPDC059007]|uniref:hypothetical protein n=1 Tax=Nonomuraea sp. NPDC059007 TaxID=3346692 RepID=UPI00368A05D1
MNIDLDPYTYVTLTMTSEDKPSLDVSFYSAELRVHGGVIDEWRPYLALHSREAHVSVSTCGPVTDTDLVIARKLAAKAAQYLADCERLHTAQNTPSPSQDEAA